MLSILILNIINSDTTNIINTDTKYYQCSLCFLSTTNTGFYMLPLCNISQIATGVPYSESLRNKSQSGPILINIRRNLTCFRPVRSFHLLGWGPQSLGHSQTLLTLLLLYDTLLYYTHFIVGAGCQICLTHL